MSTAEGATPATAQAKELLAQANLESAGQNLPPKGHANAFRL